MIVVDRVKALAMGMGFYYTGKPCKHGHLSIRLTTSAKCVACDREYKARAYAENAEAFKKRTRDWRACNLERARASDRIRNNRKDRTTLYAETYRANTAKRRASKLNATPAWADHAGIKAFYAACPKGYQVDHIVPLQGETVCGLHVLDNLQYLPESTNKSKGNRWSDPS